MLSPEQHDHFRRQGLVHLEALLPGDVYLTDMRLLHTPAPNATDKLRVMLTHRFVIEEFADVLWDE